MDIERIAIKALQHAYEIHEELGAAGEEEVETNQFGDTALRGDFAAEEAVIEVLREEDVQIRIISEEHGLVTIGDPVFLGILDGLDGSSVYKEARGVGRYGTMFAMFGNTNPTYDDYLFSGIMEHSTGRLFYASKGSGSRLIEKDVQKRTQCSGAKHLTLIARIYVDEYFDFNRQTFSEKLAGFDLSYLRSSAVYHADLSSGNTDLVLECTRKGNLEIAAGYGLIRESGAVMVDINGENLGPKLYLKFGQDKHVPIISAATMELARELIEQISR